MLKARMVIITYIVRLLIAAVSLSLLSCGAEESTETSPPTIDASLSATQIRQSESITMSWKASSGAVTLMPGNIALVNEGTMELKPDRSTQFVLAAKNEHGDAIKVLKLEVTLPPN